ncbi:hypothetical protein F441_09605 [Phytophthora nicotianae CJ01A1]|uniref:Uncharacterized protein n=4 Tax=Phytophthora nicotianae TaxID=4792 RepID=V9FRB8_PHYNI|nr:hypothetical protein F443_03468 [Phytophthora nicotianae P1569]ETK79233.1 hypothetical protein L915_14894 [Phytophthora nicotianae]ETL32657.1 hypothetical protein L916_14795 [Phytophthora nicotianae]ETP15689.1 hypothetical protein F441_09605 [Phytophthora nicotianae CJ01A1]ETP28410.1 hypothetical protein F442_22302 [Phytophthora nicotianae P10297]
MGYTAPTPDPASAYRHPRDPSYCTFVIKHCVSCGLRHPEPTIGATELVGDAARGAPREK